MSEPVSVVVAKHMASTSYIALPNEGAPAPRNDGSRLLYAASTVATIQLGLSVAVAAAAAVIGSALLSYDSFASSALVSKPVSAGCSPQ